MRINQVSGNKPDRIGTDVKNAGATTILTGQPVCLAFNGTDDGIAVVLPSGATSKAFSMLFGVALGPIAPGAQGEAQVFGMCNSVLMIRQTRGASTDVWLTQATITDAIPLVVNSVLDMFASSAGSIAQTAFLPFMMLAQSLASFASSASATSDTRTAITASVKAFVRLL